MLDPVNLNKIVNIAIEVVASETFGIVKGFSLHTTEESQQIADELERRLRGLVLMYSDIPTMEHDEEQLKLIISGYLKHTSLVTIQDVDFYTDSVRKLRQIIGEEAYQTWRTTL